MVNFSENCAPTFRKNVAEADITTPNFLKSLQFCWSQPRLLLLKRVFLPLKEASQWLLSVRRVNSLPDNMKWNKLYQFQIYQRHSKIFGHTSLFLPQKSILKNLSFTSIFTTKKTLVATFSETCKPISKIYVASQGIMIPKLLETFQCFRSHFYLFALEKYS